MFRLMERHLEWLRSDDNLVTKIQQNLVQCEGVSPHYDTFML